MTGLFALLLTVGYPLIKLEVKRLYNHWFVSRQKRQLTTLLPALIAFNDKCVGKVWPGNRNLQLEFEDMLQKLDITNHGSLRARKSEEGGGGIRTLMKQMQDLGLVFIEDESKKSRLTLISESLIKGDISFVEGMTLQLQRYQYPSATAYKGHGAIDPSFKVHPFQFLVRLLCDPRLENHLGTEEIAYIVIHDAKTDSSPDFEKVVNSILSYRAGDLSLVNCKKSQEKYKSFYNIANTLLNYLYLTQFIDKGHKSVSLRSGKEKEAKRFIQENPKFIPHPELKENYIRAYGKGTAAKDLRDFSKKNTLSRKDIEEARMRSEYVLLSLRTPITGITNKIVKEISQRTGLDEIKVDRFLRKTFPGGNIDDFFTSYRELSVMGTEGAKEFEEATCEIFRNIFGFKAIHVGPLGNTPDVYIESDEGKFCGIIDNKAYKNGYSISGDHKRVMEDVYIPDVKRYGGDLYPLAFFSYIAGSFGKNINSQILSIFNDTRIPGSAMPVDLFINLAVGYSKEDYSLSKVIEVFSVNREVTLNDL
ncbi:AlwI family type II restriction endonuclease [Parabacteroides goldsteinii]|uniref:AlwI family type II restriction endonuclease n=1 Tax=Parabacteroides goldsteinii TaxID=328812 RepID=UPI00256F1FDB|nr:AlwI family type II restriction endonuclease [Parabacteroides goldsteinii]